jgi:hypothetical protein
MSEIKLFNEKESYDFLNIYNQEEIFCSVNNTKNFFKSNSNEDIMNSSLFSSLERKKTASTNRFYNSFSNPNISQTQKNSMRLNNPNIIYLSDLFSKVHLFGIYDMPLHFHSDFIKFLKLKIPKNIFTLNELKEYLINEITREAKTLMNLRFENKQDGRIIF